MSKILSEVMVISNRNLFKNRKRFEWFCNKHNFEKEIMLNYEYMIRQMAEENFSYKQPIVYAILRDKESWEFFSYKRQKWLLEDRLAWTHTLWIWGHIQKEVEFSPNPLRTSLSNILRDKLSIDCKSCGIHLLWYINSDKKKVSEVHFWVVYLVDIDKNLVKSLDKNIDPEFLSLEECLGRNKDIDYFEDWSKIALKEIKGLY